MDPARWTPMNPQPFVRDPEHGRLPMLGHRLCCGDAGTRIRTRSLFPVGYELGADFIWRDHTGRMVGPKQVGADVSRYGADYCAYREGAWPLGTGRLLEGNDWATHYDEWGRRIPTAEEDTAYERLQARWAENAAQGA